MSSQEVFHQKITATSGLPSNSVYDILQDDKGFLWIATNEGVCRFDGRHFTTFKSKSRSDKSGSFLKKDVYGRIWFETFDGYLNYVQNDSIYKLENQSKPTNFINYAIDKKQIIYATQSGFEICDLKTLKKIKKQNLPNFQTCFLENINQKTYFFNPFLQSRTVEKKQIISGTKGLQTQIVAPIFTTSNTIYCADKSNTNRFIYKISNGVSEPLFEYKSNQTIQNLYFLQNKFWICTNKGLIVLDKNGKKLNNKPFFENFSITSFCIDAENNYWLGTLNDGIIKFSDFDEIQIDLTTIKPILLSQENDKIIVGTENGSLFSISKNFEQVDKIPLKCKNQILYINNLHPKFNFIAADGLYKTSKNFDVLDKQTYALKSIDFVNENEAVVAVSGFIGFINFDNLNPKSTAGNFEYVLNHFRLKENIRGKTALWNAAENEALFLTNMGLFSYKNNRLSELKIKNSNVNIRSIKKAKNVIYALADDGKLYQYSKNNFVEIKTNIAEINFFRSVNDEIYLGTKNAICHLQNNRINSIENIKINEKIEDLQTDSLYYYVLSNKNIIRFSKNSSKKNQDKNRLYLEKFWVNNQDYPNRNKSNLQYNQNDIRLQVAIIDYEKKNSVFYKINSDSWKEILNYGNVLELSSLSPNKYKIEFSNQKNGIVLQTISFEITKPFWEKIWFYTLILLILSGITVAVYYNRLKQIKVKNNLIIDKLKLENNLNENRLKLIKAQMNPHFFFNALNTIQSFIATNQTAEATDYLTKFSILTRIILEMTDVSWIAVEDEIRMQSLYLDLQKVRLTDFDFQILHSDKRINNVEIPTMLLQPYIENAIIHGLAHKIGAKKLLLSFKIIDNKLIILINDNGIGIKKANEINAKNKTKNASFATKATLERIEIINRNNFEIEIETSEISNTYESILGTEVKITMEIKHENL